MKYLGIYRIANMFFNIRRTISISALVEILRDKRNLLASDNRLIPKDWLTNFWFLGTLFFLYLPTTDSMICGIGIEYHEFMHIEPVTGIVRQQAKLDFK